MAKKRSAAQRRNDKRLGRLAKGRKAPKRKYAAKKSSGGKRKKSGMFNNLVPMNTEQHIISFSAGAITAPINDLMKPVQTKYLGWAGQYSDEAALMAAGVVGHKFGGKISPMVRKVGAKLYETGVISLGQQTGSGFAQSIVNKIKGGNTGAQNTGGAVIIG